MFETPSKTLQSTSPGAFESQSLVRALSEATALFARHRLFGLTWLDRDLVALRSYGGLADFVPIGQRVTETVLPLLGLDDALLALVAAPDIPFEMPNVALVGVNGSSPRLNLQIYWMPQREHFLLFISKVLSTGELEIGLAQQVRARMIVEAELASQSKALAAVNTELTRANRDLSEFAYVISHDLKAPLRAMRYFAEDLERAVCEPGNVPPQAFIAQIKSQSRRMSQMLTDLLAYSKIGRETEALDTVDTAQLINSIVASMPRPIAFKILVAGAWPVLATYVAPLDLILRNLIVNAVTHHDRPDGLVQISGRVLEHTMEIEISDDGPGIPPAWHELIFQPFKTVGDAPLADRSGIGLALVRRTLETIGATLVLKSDPAIARGTLITVQWPLSAGV